MKNSKILSVIKLTIKIYFTIVGAAGFLITYYGLCYPGFFAANATVLSALMMGSILGTLFLGLVFGLAWLIVELKRSEPPQS